MRALTGLLSLRVLVLAVLLAAALNYTPSSINAWAARIDSAVLRLCIDFIDLPPPTHSLTAIHLSDLEYTALLADPAGNRALAPCGKSTGVNGSGACVEALTLTPSAADILVDHWSQQANIKPTELATHHS